MSSPISPAGSPIPDDLYQLRRFHPTMASIVASWVNDAHELFWLAPKTFPPLTPEKVIEWAGVDARPWVMTRGDAEEVVGYVELNPMPGQPRHLWIGHCILRPSDRGVGLGRRIVELSLEEAFLARRASRVSLVVFPDNTPAILCYRRVGMVDAGEQVKYFRTTGRQQRMLQMSITADQFARLRTSTRAVREDA